VFDKSNTYIYNFLLPAFLLKNLIQHVAFTDLFQDFGIGDGFADYFILIF